MNESDDPGHTRDMERRGVPEHASRLVLGVLLSALGIHGERKRKLLDDLSAWAENGLERLVGKRRGASRPRERSGSGPRGNGESAGISSLL